jgi:hypothetical protein
MWFIEQLGGTSDPVLQNGPNTLPKTININDLERYPSRPAAEFLRDMISRFRNLEWIPGGLYHPSELRDEEDVDYYTNYKTLYKTCGWPDKFDPIMFEELRFQGGKKYQYHLPSPKATEEEKSYEALNHLYVPIMANAREIVQQQIHLVDAKYKLEHKMYNDKWERQQLEGQMYGTESTLQPMKTWERDQAKLRTELDFRTSDLEALRTRTGQYAGPSWAGVSDAQFRRMYEEAAADKRISVICRLLDDKDADERAERQYKEAKQAARESPQEAWDALAARNKLFEDDWADRWSILGSGRSVQDMKALLDEDLSWQELQRRIVYALEKKEDRSWKGKRLWRNDGGKVAMVLEH